VRPACGLGVPQVGSCCAGAGAPSSPPSFAPPLLCLALTPATPPLNIATPRAAQAARAEKKSRKRNLALLSFGEDAEAEEAQLKGMGRK
jgi:hypothetical protein